VKPKISPGTTSTARRPSRSTSLKLLPLLSFNLTNVDPSVTGRYDVPASPMVV
jgi:hypothetical protein